MAIDDATLRLEVRAQILAERLSVRQTEALVEKLKARSSGDNGKGEVVAKDPIRDLSPTEARMRTIVDDLSRIFGVKVNHSGTSSKGKITLPYSSRVELDRILTQLHNRG